MQSQWIDSPAGSPCQVSPEIAALKEAYLAAQKVAWGLSCASSQLNSMQSPDVKDCAALIRVALQKPERERQSAIKAAQLEVIQRQVVYFSAISSFNAYAVSWTASRRSLVEALEAVLLPKEEPKSKWSASAQYLDMDLALNCNMLASLIDGCDIAINEVNKRYRFSSPTQKHAEAGFQKVFDALVAEVTTRNWIVDARLGCRARHSQDILRDIAVEKVSPADLPEEFIKCTALDAARVEFERAFNWELTSACRDFNQSTRGTFNETELSEALLSASSIESMLHVEERREEKLRTFGTAWRKIRQRVDHCQELYIKFAELLPEALAEAAAIEDVNMRRRAQTLCMFAARRLKENLKYIREADRNVGEFGMTDVNAAFARRHQALVERLKTKEIHRPTTRCREETYMGD